MASTLFEATSSQHSSWAGRNAELAASEPQPAALPLPLACELTWGDRVPETESPPELWTSYTSPPARFSQHKPPRRGSYTTANRGGAVRSVWGSSKKGRGHFSRFKYRLGCCETVGKYRLALHECLDGREPTRRNVSSLTCRVEVSELAAELEWAPETALPGVLGRAVVCLESVLPL